MYKYSLCRAVPTFLLLGGFAIASQGAVQNRIVGGEDSRPVALAGSVSPRLSKAAQFTDLGAADTGRMLESMTLRFNMTDTQRAALRHLLEDQQNPASTKYRQWLTPEQFGVRFGLGSEDIATVARWLTSQGFKIVSMARSGTFIEFSGTVAQAQAAFQTSIHRVSVNVGGQTEDHLANVIPVSLPSALAGVVGSVAGLNNFKLKPRSQVRQVQANADPRFTSSLSGSTFIAPGDFYTIYDVKPLLASSINGAGITIAVAGQTDLSLNDVAAFRLAAGLSANVPTVKLYGTDPGTSAADIDEAQLDVEWSGAVAPSASILFVNSTNVINSLMQIIDNKLAPIATISYGECEAGTGPQELASLNTLFMQANAQGMTIVGPSGDSGATDCDYHSTTATQGLAVDFPASSPYVTGLGGTMFHEGSDTYFNSTNGANAGSATSYIPESVWNESAIVGQLAASGGGVSTFFTKPTWQTGAGVPNDRFRDVPDVSLNAGANHDGYLFCSKGSCVNGFRTSATPSPTCSTGNCLNVVGGTSVSAPAFAGILALVAQTIQSNIGNANPRLYALAQSDLSSTVFHDVTTGNNSSPCTKGSTGCASGGSIGYSATVGYDLATGWGSVDAFNLANSWTANQTSGTPAAGGDFTLTPATTTTTVKSGADAAGIVFTVTPVNGFIGSIGFGKPSVSVLLNATYFFTVNPVEISSTAAGTTTLNLSAFVANAQAGTGLLQAGPEGSATLAPSPASGPGWYAGSDGLLSCVFLLMAPKRRRWGGLIAAIMAVGALSAMVGCGSGGNVAPGQTNAAPGTYTVYVTATGTNAANITVSHTSQVTFIVQ